MSHSEEEINDAIKSQRLVCRKLLEIMDLQGDVDTLLRDSLSPFGLMVSFGNASGPVAPMPLTALKSSLYITRPSLMPHTASRANLEEIAGDLFKIVGSGKVKIKIDQRYALGDAAQAHRDLEARKTTGSTLIIPE